jgi:zinc finger SWIM domain-containing protein 3
VFKNFKAEVVAVRDHCSIVGIAQVDTAKFLAINDVSKQRDMLVQWCTLTNFGTCSCKLFERMGIPCRHIILTLRSEKIYELPSIYVLKR